MSASTFGEFVLALVPTLAAAGAIGAILGGLAVHTWRSRITPHLRRLRSPRRRRVEVSEGECGAWGFTTTTTTTTTPAPSAPALNPEAVRWN